MTEPPEPDDDARRSIHRAEPSDRATPDPFEGAEWDDDTASALAPHSVPPTRRRRRVSRRRLRRRRRIGWAAIVVGGLIVLTGVWIVVTGLLARSQLMNARAQIQTLRAQIVSGDLETARATARSLAGHAHSAHGLTTGPAWAAAAAIPGAGNPARTVRVMTTQIDTLGERVLPQLVEASRRLDPARLRGPDATIDLGPIEKAAPILDGARAAVERAQARVAGQPSTTWFAAVDAARAQLLGELRSLTSTVRSADLAARVAPAMLGQHGTKRYFVAFQNEAEARGTGGVPGAFAIVRVQGGKLSFERFESDTTLEIVPTGLSFGRDYDALFRGAQTTSRYVNGNLSPHFPYAAQVWLAMWRKHSGESLDGVVAIDPTALSYLLAVTGPATLPDHSQVNAGNVVSLTQSGIYARFPRPADQLRRKRYLLDLASAVSRRLLDARADGTALIRAAGRAAGERRVLLYSVDPKIEADLAQTSVGGTIADTTAPYVGLSIVNDGGNKLDYYLDRSLAWRADGCASRRSVTVTIELHNGAPATGLAYNVTARSDQHGPGVKPGDNRLLVSYYATRAAQLRSVAVDGKAGTASAGRDLGRPVYTVDLELPRGSTRTVVLHLEEPRGEGAPVVLRQPGVRPLKTDVRAPNCG